VREKGRSAWFTEDYFAKGNMDETGQRGWGAGRQRLLNGGKKKQRIPCINALAKRKLESHQEMEKKSQILERGDQT